ncbi:facilitated trehalose transporter Tret1-like [Zophobas morio]|uniref:facilitated trehalose transporter Tret1-like n=1 Tax=Zophobas morio TaxID=2755281 RepID=UPI0030833441
MSLTLTTMNQPRRLYQYLTAFTALLTIVTSGLHYAWPSPSIPQFISGNTTSFKITNDEGSWIIIMQLIAPIPSCFLGAAIIDVIGRKKSILLTAIPYMIGWLMVVFAKSGVELCIARFFAGISDGVAFTVIPLYIGEIADPEIRGLLGAGISATWIFGMLLINVVGSYLSITMTAAICTVVPCLLLATFVWMPESPYFLILKNDIEAARSALRKFRGRTDVEEELMRLEEAVKNQNKRNGKVLELFTKKSNRKSLGIITVVRNSQQMSGVAAISFYTLTIFHEAGDFMSPLSATILYVVIQCVMTILCSIIIDKTGRRPLLISSLIGSGICLFVEGSYFYVKDFTDIDVSSFNFVPVVALIGYVVIFNLGAQPIPLLVQGELFPTNVKGLASCLSEVYFCILAAIFSKCFQVMRDHFGIYVPFYIFAVCCMINLIFVILFVPETKGKTLEEIQEALCERKKEKGGGLV